MSQLIDSLDDAIIRKLGDRPFYTLRELVEAGVFGSLPGLRRMLKNGRLTFVQVSPRRFVIPKSELLSYLTENLTFRKENVNLLEFAENDA